MEQKATPKDLLQATAQIVGAYVAENEVSMDKVQQMIRDTYATLSNVAGEAVVEGGASKPAVPVENSVQDDFIVCLEDGKKLKMLKRHLMTSFGMTPEEYRKRWNLPLDYPMVAPRYAEKRSSLAKSIGLGTRPRRTRRAKSQETTAKTQAA